MLHPSTENLTKSVDVQRVEARRKLIIDALLAAGGEPADGRWAHVAQLCRLGVTQRGRRWLGTNVERGTLMKDAHQLPKAPVDAPNHEEKKRNQDDNLRQKIESWKRAVTQDLVSGASDTSGTIGNREDIRRSSVARQIDDTGRSATLKFKVIKRSAASNVFKRPNPAQSSPRSLTQAVMDDRTTSGAELSFLPPSFPPHLATSTPQHPTRRKPAPIPRVTVSSPCIATTNAQACDDTMPPHMSQVPEHVPSSSHNVDPKTPPLPTLSELLDTSRRMKARRRRMSQSTKDQVTHRTDSSPPHLTGRPGNHSFAANDDVSHESVGLNARFKARTNGLEYLNVHDPGGVEFDPPFTSTQKSVAVNDNSCPTDRDLWEGYNSQFDIDCRTTDVAKLLEKDVVVEY